MICHDDDDQCEAEEIRTSLARARVVVIKGYDCSSRRVLYWQMVMKKSFVLSSVVCYCVIR